MNIKIRVLSVAAAIAVSFVLTASVVQAQHHNEKEVRDALRSLSSKVDDLEYNLRYRLLSTSSPAGDISNAMDIIQNFRDATDEFEVNLNKHRENAADVNKIVAAARPIESFLQANPQNQKVDEDWSGVKRQVGRIGSNYGVTPNWTGTNDPDINVADQKVTVRKSGKTQSVGLSGTYELDRARSENIEDIVSSTNVADDQREDLHDKLEAPEQIAIDIRGDQVTLASSIASPITFSADGQQKTETDSNGKTIHVRAAINGDDLVVSSLGGETDYTITFTSMSNGQSMKIQRRITTEYLSETVIAESIYNKTDTVARLGIDTHTASQGTAKANDPDTGDYSDNDNSGTIANGGNGGTLPAPRPGAPRTTTSPPGNYVVPNGAVMSGTLENEINTKISQNNDRFRMTVQSPNEFRGAVIEGYLSNIGRSGKVTGQASVTLHFERITLRDGQSYSFAGYLQRVKDQSGKVFSIDDESTIRGDSQSRQTMTRGALGSGVGAVIGLIAGGGKGAAIGAMIGGGAGAGSIYAQGKDDIRLPSGSTITVQASAPAK